jgi:phosphate:Na+ symporter
MPPSAAAAGPVRRAGAALPDQIALLHALDHASRLADRTLQAERIAALSRHPALEAGGARLAAALEVAGRDWDAAGEVAHRLWEDLHADREGTRATLIDEAAAGRMSATALTTRLDAGRWLYRTAYHLWRISHHLAPGGCSAPGSN